MRSFSSNQYNYVCVEIFHLPHWINAFLSEPSHLDCHQRLRERKQILPLFQFQIHAQHCETTAL